MCLETLSLPLYANVWMKDLKNISEEISCIGKIKAYCQYNEVPLGKKARFVTLQEKKEAQRTDCPSRR